jgi:two-component system OmpR family response regulator
MAFTLSPSHLPSAFAGPQLPAASGLAGVNVLLFVAEPALREALGIVLGHHGCNVVAAEASASALPQTEEIRADIAIAEDPPLRAPLYDLCREWRRRTDAPLLVVGRAEDEVVEAAYRYAGADAYLRRPLSAFTLLQRVHDLVAGRRTRALEPPAEPVLDTRRRRLLCGGRAIELTRREVQLFDALAQHPGSVVPRRTLVERVWGAGSLGIDLRTVDAVVARIRRRMRAVGHPSCIETVAGVGYRLQPCRLVRVEGEPKPA